MPGGIITRVIVPPSCALIVLSFGHSNMYIKILLLIAMGGFWTL